VDVARAALFIAMHRTPELDVDACIAQLDDMGRALEARLPPPDERYTRRMLLAINAFMFEELGFRGADKTAFYVTENSCLDVVLATRRGIPLTLSLVYIELARRVRLPMVGVNIPAHYLIRPAVEDIEVWRSWPALPRRQHALTCMRAQVLVDPFNGGALICVEDAEALLAPMYGTDAKVEIDRSFFRDNEPKPRSFLTRMLTNLKARLAGGASFACAQACD
jgi:regulator of sirC expression with transglutaminase-like and TPR domain